MAFFRFNVAATCAIFQLFVFWCAISSVYHACTQQRQKAPLSRVEFYPPGGCVWRINFKLKATSMNIEVIITHWWQWDFNAACSMAKGERRSAICHESLLVFLTSASYKQFREFSDGKINYVVLWHSHNFQLERMCAFVCVRKHNFQTNRRLIYARPHIGEKRHTYIRISHN